MKPEDVNVAFSALMGAIEQAEGREPAKEAATYQEFLRKLLERPEGSPNTARELTSAIRADREVMRAFWHHLEELKSRTPALPDHVRQELMLDEAEADASRLYAFWVGVICGGLDTLRRNGTNVEAELGLTDQEKG